MSRSKKRCATPESWHNPPAHFGVIGLGTMGRNLAVGAARSRSPQRLAFWCPSNVTALAYFDGYRSATLPQNLTQAQREAFGALKKERIDRSGECHSEW